QLSWATDTDTNTQLSEEQVDDFVGGMVTGNTETLIAVTYQDDDGTIDFVVDEANINHDSLTGFVANEHIDWTGAGAGTIHTDNYIEDDDLGVNEVYGSGWNADTNSPEKDDVYDYLHQIDTNDDGDVDNIDATALAAAETDPTLTNDAAVTIGAGGGNVTLTFNSDGGTDGTILWDGSNDELEIANGKVGIGTTAPKTKLEVIGTMSGQALNVTSVVASETGAVFIDVNVSGTGVLIDSEATNAPGLAIDMPNADASAHPHILFGYNGQFPINLFGSGTDALKTSNVFAANGGIFQSTSDSTTMFQVLDADGGTPIFNIDTTNERVGINKAAPSVSLDVVGAIASTSSVSGTKGIFNTGTTPSAHTYGYALNLYGQRTGDYQQQGVVGNFLDNTAGDLGWDHTGMFYSMQRRGGGTTSTMIGMAAGIGVEDNSTITNGIGLELYAPNTWGLTEGTIGTLKGINIKGYGPGTGDVSIGNSYGIYMTSPADLGGVTISGSDYGIYQASAASDNYFAGAVGIGAATPGSKLEIEDSGDNNVLLLNDSDGLCEAQPSAGSLTWSCSSDKKLKKNIKNAHDVIPGLMQIPIKDYTIKASNKDTMGVIAQELREIYPDMVTSSKMNTSLQIFSGSTVVIENERIVITDADGTVRVGTGTVTNHSSGSITVEDDILMVSELPQWKIIKAIQEQQDEIDNLNDNLNYAPNKQNLNSIEYQVIENGDVLCIDPDRDASVIRCSDKNNEIFIGIASGAAKEEGQISVTLNGIVNVKVNSEGGTIGRGTNLSAASLSGYLKKASSSDKNIIGISLGVMDQPTGVMSVLIK
ncbi:tail fiber domain-containing protein, partial [Patescibacteria group bacterium]|nr:tail fiber domain-containing protein [Patescibacteria group bacterium]MBU1911733.1 tail fiber domain-containing protein [Patescibacteria group bacterium]